MKYFSQLIQIKIVSYILHDAKIMLSMYFKQKCDDMEIIQHYY